MNRNRIVLPSICLSLICICCNAQEVRYFEQNGVTYRETRNTVQQPVREVRYQDEQETYYRQQVTTQFQDYAQLGYQPRTTYQWQPRWHGWWRIFRGPHVAYHLVPRTSWETTSQTVRVPVTQAKWVPETRTVRKAIPSLRMVQKEQVTRTAMGPAANHTTMANANVAPALSYRVPASQMQIATVPMQPSYGNVGGIARLDGDLPRGSTAVQYIPPTRILR